MKKHYDILISGSIQNIAFPFRIMKTAEELHICGSTGYMSENSIKIKAEGDEAMLNKFVEWCRIGVPEAKISELKVEESRYLNYKEFVIVDKI